MVQGPLKPVQPTSRDPEEIDLGDGHRVAAYSRYRAFARGQQWQGNPKPGDVRLTYNYTAALIRKVASYVFPKSPTFDFGDEDDAALTEKALADVISALNLSALDVELEVEASTIGDACVKVTWNTIDAMPSVVSVDPGALVVQWSPHNPHHAHAVTHAYELPGYSVRLLGHDFGLIEDEKTYRVDEVWTRTTWTLKIGDVEKRQANPYGWIPYVFLRNKMHARRFWGRSDVPDLEQAQQEFNREMSVLSRIMALSGAPIAVLEGVDATIGLHAVPGAKWELPADSKAYLLDLMAGSGVRMHIDYIEQIRTTLHDLSETPRTAFGDSGRALSGAALEVEIQPLVQRVRRKQLGWNPFFDERNRRILALMQKYGTVPLGKNHICTTIWAPILPSDDAQDALTNVQLVSSGIRSKYTAIQQMGEEDPAAELARIEEEQAAAFDRELQLAQAQPAFGRSDSKPIEEKK